MSNFIKAWKNFHLLRNVGYFEEVKKSNDGEKDAGINIYRTEYGRLDIQDGVWMNSMAFYRVALSSISRAVFSAASVYEIPPNISAISLALASPFN
jgi:hypothetical protein